MIGVEIEKAMKRITLQLVSFYSSGYEVPWESTTVIKGVIVQVILVH